MAAPSDARRPMCTSTTRRLGGNARRSRAAEDMVTVEVDEHEAEGEAELLPGDDADEVEVVPDPEEVLRDAVRTRERRTNAPPSKSACGSSTTMMSFLRNGVNSLEVRCKERLGRWKGRGRSIQIGT